MDNILLSDSSIGESRSIVGWTNKSRIGQSTLKYCNIGYREIG